MSAGLSVDRFAAGGSVPRLSAVGASPLLSDMKASCVCRIFCRLPLTSRDSYWPLSIVRAFVRRSRPGLSVAAPFGLRCLTSPSDGTDYYALC